MDKSQTKEINYKHLKPINIILNPKFESGELQEQGLYQPITIYDKPIEPEKLKDSNEDFLQEVNGLLNRKDFDEDNGYTKNSRVISPQDGIMYYYSKNKGQINARLEGGQIMNFSKIKMLICVTMYAEDRKMLEKTLKGIQKNVRNFNLQYNISPEQIVVVVLQDGIMKMQEEMVDFFCEKDIKRWNKQGLDEQQREVSKKDTVKRRRQLINYENNLYKNPKTGKNQRVDLNNGLPPSLPKKIALLYQEQENFFPLDSDFDNFPLTCLYLHKHLNAKKLSSHLWFFEGFCRQFQPKYCAFIDVGTIPNEFGLVKYFEALEGDQNIGGVSGFLGIEQEKSQRELKEEEEMDQKLLTQSEQEWIKEGYFEVKYYQDGGKEVIVQQKQTNQEQNKEILSEKQKQEKEEEQKLLIQKQKYANKNRKRLLRFSLENAQLFEYTISHIIDKNFESYLGFLHVLPGAWSAYRYDALAKGNLYRENLLQKRYLKQILNPGLGVGDYKEANMYLAEDRILCLGIFCQVNSNYSLKYIPDAVAETDPVQTFEEFLNQRRRWINSSWFALEYVLRNYATDLEFSAHNMWTKTISLPFNMLVAQLGQLNMYYLLGLYLFVVCTIFSQLVNALAVQFNSDIKDFEDLNKEDQKMQLKVNNSARTMSGFISCFGFFTFLGLLALGFIKVFNLFTPAVTRRAWHIIKSTCAYLFYSATYFNTLVIFSFCNIDDVTWGTKGITSGEVNDYYLSKIQFVSSWIFQNSLLCFLLVLFNSLTASTQIRQFSQEYSYLNLSQLKENNLLASQLKLNQSQLQQFNKNNLNNLNTSQNLKGKQNSGQSQNTSQNQNQNQNLSYPQSQSPRNLQREKQGIVLEEDSEEEESKHNLFDDKNNDNNQEEEEEEEEDKLI
ncbi:hypothetical protein PPERSA_07405 [Pseudocohnilembus persalinus]|uniref:chitin synthase n=1 Tax=Pseudocohnilembus persalinus TaxID=266149 RepID=A0A0V0QAI6_PSEPJ|nr:hypothetical protein PPERSA_07405 [Pseudocohnilembus persalinus]|eukprot:KRW99162.1 hypothetical protein PPERSA_07405 [Pseudocohnilembus persalinus]